MSLKTTKCLDDFFLGHRSYFYRFYKTFHDASFEIKKSQDCVIRLCKVIRKLNYVLTITPSFFDESQKDFCFFGDKKSSSIESDQMKRISDYFVVFIVGYRWNYSITTMSFYLF